MEPRTRQFLTLPFTLTAVFVFSAVTVSFVPSPYENWSEPFVGPVCATILIIAAFALDPARPRTVGAITLGIGSLVAWWLLHNASYPERHPRAYQPTLIPFYATLAACVLSYSVCWVLCRSRPISSA